MRWYLDFFAKALRARAAVEIVERVGLVTLRLQCDVLGAKVDGYKHT